MLTPIRCYSKPDPEMKLNHPKDLDDGSIESLTQISKIIHVTKRRKIWSSSTNYVKDLAVISERKYMRKIYNRFDMCVLDDGDSFHNHLYRYCFEEHKWIDITQEINIGNSFSISGQSSGIMQLRAMLSKVYDGFHRLSEIDTSNSNEEDMFPRYEWSKSSPSLTEIEIWKDSKPLWKKFVSNIKSFVSSDPIGDTTRYQIYLAREKERQSKLRKREKAKIAEEKELHLRQQLLYNRPSIWVLRKRQSTFTSLLDAYKTSRYIVFRLKDHAYIIGGNTSRNEKDKNEKLEFEKYNFKEQRWTECEHTLLYPLQYATVSVSSDQTYAIFIDRPKTWKRKGRERTRIIMFEEETGFTLIEDKMIRLSNDDDDVAIVLQN